MATLIAGILIGVVFASVFWRWPDIVRELPFLTRIEAFLAALRQGAGVSAAPAAAQPERAAEPLTVKLRKLEAEFSPAAENAAHPREFLDQAAFQEMAALLGS